MCGRCAPAAVAVLTLLLMVATAPAARAGEWMQVSCVNPNGTAAPFQGWTGSSATGVAGLHEPQFAPDPANRFLVCARILSPCQNGGYAWSGTVTLPADRGGNLIAAASCAGANGAATNTCTTGQDAADNFASVFISSANLLLQNNAVPGGSGFTGTALELGARGLTHLTFTAADTAGPGVYQVQVFVDGTPVYSQTPNTNSGQCVPVDTDPASGALMFDYQQPCPPAESVDVPISTTGLQDGRHELTVKVVDAAGNVATALDQTITTSNPLVTPRPAKGVRAQFVILWHWTGLRTTLRSITVRKLPRRAAIHVSCTGRGCPRLRLRSATGKKLKRLLAGLSGRAFRAGDRLHLTVTAPHLRSEKILVTIRNNRIPQARLLH